MDPRKDQDQIVRDLVEAEQDHRLLETWGSSLLQGLRESAEKMGHITVTTSDGKVTSGHVLKVTTSGIAVRPPMTVTDVYVRERHIVSVSVHRTPDQSARFSRTN